MTASNLGRVSVEASQPKQAGTKCVPKCLPMSHQNSGDHGHEMYPQQFVRLVGCHEIHAPPVRAKEETKLH